MGDPRYVTPKKGPDNIPISWIPIPIASTIYPSHADVFQIHSLKLTNVP